MAAYKQVTVEAAKHLAEHFGKSIVVIVAVDRVHELTHFTSYGVSPQDKQEAAILADDICIATGHSLDEMTSFEDFRYADQAKTKAESERLTDLIQSVSKRCECYVGPDGQFIKELYAILQPKTESPAAAAEPVEIPENDIPY